MKVMKILTLILLAVSIGSATTLFSQNLPTVTHPAVGNVHPAVADAHPAKRDPHPAASMEKHPAFPEHSSDDTATTAAEPIVTVAANPVVPMTVETFSVPTFIPNPAGQQTAATTSNPVTTTPNPVPLAAPVADDGSEQ
jgi:hypothetical protein